MNHKKASALMLGIYGLDCLVLTPYILLKGLGQEAGFLMSRGYNLIGISWFYIWFILFSFLLIFGLKYLFKFYDYALKRNAKYPKWALLIVWFIGMVAVIINNLRFI